VFEEGEMAFRRGDTLFLYTDGVTEAMNPREELTGEEWMLRELAAIRGQPCDAMIKALRAALQRYAAGAEQSDDITMVAFRFKGAATA